ncbi:MAG: type II toxin-antitoxin system Phd/YefM family antitoxin [Gammaproteobacteria bacterium]|nr:type II toxin-antitoxin system Phd/YefM family antitoxin [Gammaproteobacteria bacterium]
MTTEMTTIDAKEKFADLITHVSHSKERIALTRRGKEVAAIVPIEDLHFLETIQDKSDLQAAIASLKEARSNGLITLEQLKEETGV